jgi:protein involved in polysaccharide export with SLBB domain
MPVKKTATLLFFLAALIAPAMPQAQAPAQAAAAGARPGVPADQVAIAQERLSLATSSIDYPVTPADVYTLTYRLSTGAVQTQSVQVASDYSLDLGVFGKPDARGLTFQVVKQRVEALVAQSYARSYPSLTIESVGIFRIALGGDVARPRYVNAWGLSRLAEVIEDATEPGMSLRDVLLRHQGGEAKSYDLLTAMRTGDPSLNPVVMPGDTITLKSASALIRLIGEVRHEGSYELMPGEGLRELIENFGGGLTDYAETSRIRIDRLTPRGPTAQYIDLSRAYDPPTSLAGCIAVTIASRMDDRPFVWFEGAVTTPAPAPAAGSDGLPSNARTVAPAGPAVENTRISLQIYEGEMLSDALRELKDSISPSADLSTASLYRQWSAVPIVINLQPLLAKANPPSDIPLQPYDRIFIPTLKSTVSVYGAVFAGGSFGYQPNSPASYYIGQAGGVDPERNGNGQYWILDQDGKKRKSSDMLMPGDRIYVPINSFSYNLVRYTPVVSGIISLVLVVVPFVQSYIVK